MTILERFRAHCEQRRQRELEKIAEEAVNVGYIDGDVWLMVQHVPVYRVLSKYGGLVIDLPIEHLPEQIERLRNEFIKQHTI